MDSRIKGTTRLLGLIGSPVGHSGSPAMHNYGFQALGIDAAYLAFDIKEDQVKDAISAVRTLNMQGINVTMPCKTEAAKYMDELSPAASEHCGKQGRKTLRTYNRRRRICGKP